MDAQCAIYGFVMFLPTAKSKLFSSVLALRGWQKLVPSVSYPPISWPLTVAVACRMAQRGQVLEAIGTLLSFDCLLRIGEFIQLRRQDIMVPNDSRLETKNAAAALLLRKTKTGQNMWATIQHRDVQLLLLSLLPDLRPSDRIFPFSAERFRSPSNLPAWTLV